MLYSSFSARFAERVAQWRQRIDELRSGRRHVVIWCAGAKGVMFLNLLRVATGAGVDWVVDINPREHGHFVPLMGQRIVGPDCLMQNPPDLVVVMNSGIQAGGPVHDRRYGNWLRGGEHVIHIRVRKRRKALPQQISEMGIPMLYAEPPYGNRLRK